MDEMIVEVEDYEEVVGGFDNSPFQSDNSTSDAALFKGPTQNCNDNSMASILRPALRNSDLSLADETKESRAIVVTPTLCSLSPNVILPARRSKRGSCCDNVAGWLAGWVGGWLDVTRQSVSIPLS